MCTYINKMIQISYALKTVQIFELSCFVLLATNIHGDTAKIIKNAYYTGAVLEYQPYTLWTENVRGQEISIINAKNIIKFAEQAKEQAVDILVTPEYGLSGIDIHEGSTDEFKSFLHYVPNPDEKIVPCEQYLFTNVSQTVKILSCAARNLSMYLVTSLLEIVDCKNDKENAPKDINKCPDQGFYAYNTQTVFGRRGEIVTKYRKVNLYLEDRFTPGDPHDRSDVFIADFNVAFSLQICFDIAHMRPGYYNVMKRSVRDVLMSTAWFDQMPFDLAHSIQEGWSLSLKTNLLASGYHNPSKYNIGSGIYKGFSDDKTTNIYDACSGNTLIISRIKTKRYDEKKHFNYVEEFESVCRQISSQIMNKNYLTEEKESSLKNNIICNHAIIAGDLSNYTKILLQPTEFNQSKKVQICNTKNFCCFINYTYSGKLTYYFIVFNGNMPVGNGSYSLRIQQCALLWCKSIDLKTCSERDLFLDYSDDFGPFSIQSLNFNANLIFPVGVHRDLSLIDKSHIEFDSVGGKLVVTTPIKNVLTAALYGRIFNESHN